MDHGTSPGSSDPATAPPSRTRATSGGIGRLAPLAVALALVAPLCRFGMSPDRLRAALTDSGAPAARVAAGIAGDSGRADFAPLIVPLLDSDERKVRREAVRALGELGHPGSVAPLVALTGDEDLAERAAEALAGIATPESASALRELESVGEKDVRREAEKGLRRFSVILPQWIIRDAGGRTFGSREEVFPPEELIDRLASGEDAP